MPEISSKHAALINFFRGNNGSLNHNSSLFRLKTQFSYPDKCFVFDNLPVKFQELIYGNPFPNAFKELGDGNYTKSATSVLDEMNWLMLAIRKYYRRFSKFIEWKIQFEEAFLKSYYRDAAKILDDIELEFGKSIWLIEVRLLLKEIDKGMAENKLYLSEITEKRGAHYISRIADMVSKKVEKERSTNRFTGEFKTFVSQISGAFGAQSTEYYFFKANIYGLTNYKYKPMIMAFEQRVALIDRYLTLQVCLRQHIATDSLSEIDKKELSGRIYYLYKKVEDPSLIKLQCALTGFLPESLNTEEKWAYKIINSYTEGDYSAVITECQSFLKSHLQTFDIYHIYCKSLINLGMSFRPIPGNDNLVNELLKNVYGLIKNEDDPESYARALSKMAFQLSSFSIGDQIINFLNKEVDGNGHYFRQSLLSSPVFLPSMGNFEVEGSFSIDYFNQFSILVGPDSLTAVNFLKALVEKDVDRIQALPVPQSRKFFYEALIHQYDGNYPEAINIWLHLKNNHQQISHIFKPAVEHLFFCFLKARQYEDALSLYVDTFFINPFCITRLKTEALEEELRKSKMRSVEKNINLPLFFAIAGSKKTILSNAVELYFKNCGVSTPTQFIDALSNGILNEGNLNKVYYFLHNVCTMSLFTHMVKIKGTKNKLNERLNVCVYLLNNEILESELYINEIDDIERELLIQEGLQEYDESKIFINDKMIKENLLKELESDFDRYRKYGSLLKQYPRIKVLITTALFDIETDKKPTLDRAIFSNDPMFDQFKLMFLELRDKFLFSQYGLMEFLSGRIRHGVFKSEIRPKFEKLELITERDANTIVYKQSEYWKMKLSHLSPEVLNQILNIQTVFSRKIDDLIEEDALKRYLQIKIENRNVDGWFDYEYDDIELALIYTSIPLQTTFEAFVDKCFQFLYVKTDNNLIDIRQKITGEYNDKFEAVISDFETSVRELTPENTIHEMLTKINDIKPYVQNDLNKVATWFNRSGSVTKDFYIDKIIEMSLRHTNRGYAKKEISLTRKNDCARLFKGEFYPYFIDLIRVFFVNILEHNDRLNGDIPAELVLTEQWPILKISISNDVIDNGKDRSTVSYAKVDEARSQTEGKSGFPKVKRILKSYLGRKNQNNRLEFPENTNNKFIVDCYIDIEDLIIT